MRRATVAMVWALVAVIALGASSCHLRVPANRVLVIGDSLTVGAAEAGLGRNSHATWIVDAVKNRGTNAGVVAARTHDLTRYDLVIVALGTNDYFDDKVTYGARIDAMMGELGRSRAVFWINVDAHASRLGGASKGVNPAIAAAPARYPNLRAADWDAYLAGRRSLSGVRSSDGIHYTSAGYDLRARWMEGFVA
ncbi:MAG: GDSL-type esterase/lipase family protein [Acidimicrobiales bacterium]